MLISLMVGSQCQKTRVMESFRHLLHARGHFINYFIKLANIWTSLSPVSKKDLCVGDNNLTLSSSY